MEPHHLTLWAGLAIGLAFGIAARASGFCLVSGLRGWWVTGERARIRAFALALAVAVVASQALDAAGLVDLRRSLYAQTAFAPLLVLFGGLLFGYGMAMAGNCGFGALVRFGGGDLRSLVVVVVMGIFAFVTLSGPLGPLRTLLFEQVETPEPQGIAHWLAAQTGLAPITFALPVAAALMVWALVHTPLRRDPRRILWGVAAGLAIVFCLVGTTAVHRESLGAVGVEAPSFTAPLGRTILYFMTSTAGGITFSVGLVAGVLAGAFSGSLLRGMFRWEACEDPRELGRQVSGAAMMGIGGTVAIGCSIGQGVSAMSVLAFSAPVTLGAIVVGGLVGLRHLIGGFQPE